MNIHFGKKLKLKLKDDSRFKDTPEGRPEYAEVVSQNKLTGKWYVVSDGNFGRGYTAEEIERDFEELPES